MTNIKNKVPMTSQKTIATIMIGLLAITMLSITTIAYAQQTNETKIVDPNELEFEKRGPLSTQEFDEVKTMMGFKNINLPTSIPSNLSLNSIRVLQSEDTAFKLISVFYTPEGVTTNNTDTFEDIMAKGSILLLYSYEKKDESFNWSTWARNFVSEQPEDRKIESINGKEVIMVKGGSDPRATSQVYSKSGDVLVNLVSKKYDDIALADSAKSIKP